MGYLIWQIIICLLIAFLFGLLIGYWLKSIFCKKKIREIEDRGTVSTVKESAPKVAKKSVNSDVKDDLKKILGVGPKLESMLNKNGIKNFRQVAELKSDDIKELSTKLGAFKDRITRDDWVSKAKDLYFKKYGEKV